jgi:predicted dehydrogenase
LKVAIVGCGFMGSMHANVYAALNTADLIAVVDQRPEKLAAFSEEFGVPSFARNQWRLI